MFTLQVVLLVIESSQGTFNKLELQLVRKCLDEGRALVICANKSDLLKHHHVSRNQYETNVKEHTEKFMREFGDVPVVPVSGGYCVVWYLCLWYVDVFFAFIKFLASIH